MNRKIFLSAIFAAVLLAGCGQAGATPTADLSGQVLAAVVTQLSGLPTLTPAPTSTRTPVTPTATPTPLTPTPSVSVSPTNGYPYITWTPRTCDKPSFLPDMDVIDYSKVYPGTSFTKTWRIQNIGTCTWTKQYRFMYISGDPMGADTIYLPRAVAPGDTIDISLQMKAPDIEEDYSNFWRLRNAAGEIFGTTFYVAIEVSKSAGTLTPTVTQTATVETGTATPTNTTIPGDTVTASPEPTDTP